MTFTKQLCAFSILLACLIALSSLGCVAQGRATAPASSSSPEAAGALGERRFQAREGTPKPWLGAAVKDAVDEPGCRGVRVESVVEHSPAQKAGLRAGDVITRIAGTDTTDPRLLVQTVLSLKTGVDYPVTIVRDGRQVELTVRLEPQPTGRPRFSPTEPVAEVSDKPAPRRSPLDINVLKYALIDPKTGIVTFVGKYDPSYDTGPIPYDEYLRVALQHPYPSFSLDPPKESVESLKKAQQIIDSDIARMDAPDYCDQWAQKVANLLIYDPSLEADRNRLYRNCAGAMRMSMEDFKRMYDAATGKLDMPATEFMGLAAKMVRGIGLTEAGDALGVLADGGTPEEMLSSMAEKLGLSSQYKELASKNLQPEEFRKEEIILCISELCRRFGAPENDIQSKVAAIRSGESANLIIDYMGQKISDYISKKSGRQMIDGLVLGPEVLSKMYGLPLPKADLVFKDLPLDSLLSDVFFKSDYRLKSVCTLPDAKDKVPAHLTQQELMQRLAAAAMNQKLCSVNLRAGNRLVPDEVVMRVSPSGNVVRFAESKMKVLGWLIEMQGHVDKDTTDFVSASLTKYADHLTEHYDEYARVYPEWHKLSEAAKVIALARWARNNGHTLKPASDSMTKVELPRQVNGFWSAVFEVDDSGQYLTFIAEGGASFAKDEGEGWLKPSQDVTITSDVSKQLAASAILAEQSLGVAVSGDLESARELAEKSAQAMTGEIDLARLPSLDSVPIPADPASYAAATGAAIEEASECLDKMRSAAKDMERAQQLSTSSPDEAQKLKQQATKTQEDARARLNEILAQVRNYRSDPSRAGDAVVALSSDSAVVTPIAGQPSSASGNSGGQGTPNTSTVGNAPKAEDWSKTVRQLEDVNKQIASTREALLKLNAAILANQKLFEEWEKSASEGMDRCVSMIGEIALDVGISGLSERYEIIEELAKKLPGKPEDVIERYRRLASFAQRLKEANAVRGLADLADRENKTEAELWETLRDGIGQLSGIFSLDTTIPGMWWKYGMLVADTAYNLTDLRLTWKNLKTLEANNERYAEAVQKLAARMRDLVERQREIRQKIEAGGLPETIAK